MTCCCWRLTRPAAQALGVVVPHFTDHHPLTGLEGVQGAKITMSQIALKGWDGMTVAGLQVARQGSWRWLAPGEAKWRVRAPQPRHRPTLQSRPSTRVRNSSINLWRRITRRASAVPNGVNCAPRPGLYSIHPPSASRLSIPVIEAPRTSSCTASSAGDTTFSAPVNRFQIVLYCSCRLPSHVRIFLFSASFLEKTPSDT
jgi:hypothetical protein